MALALEPPLPEATRLLMGRTERLRGWKV
ncbi:MAG: hypothetical protein ACJAX2_002947, partial [Celeribacter sp.]